MEYVYPIVVGAFALGLFLYAGLMALTKDYRILPYRSRQSVKPKDPKAYTAQLAKVVALVAVAPTVSAVVGIWSILAAVIVLIVGIVLFLVLGTRLMRKVQ